MGLDQGVAIEAGVCDESFTQRDGAIQNMTIKEIKNER